MLEVIYLDSGIRTTNNLSDFNHKNRVWIDLTNPSREELRKIKELFDLNTQTIEDLSISQERPKTEYVNDYTLLITYDLLSDENLREVCFLLGKNFLISSHKEKIPSLRWLSMAIIIIGIILLSNS